MKHFTPILAFVFLLLTGAHQGVLAGEKVTRHLPLTDFDRIAIGGVFKLKAVAGEEYAVVLTGSEKQLNYVRASVENGRLRLRSKHGRRSGHNGSIVAEVQAPRITGITVSGVAEAEIYDVEADLFSARLSGVGEVTIKGECGRLDAKVSGVGELDAEDLKCREVDVTVSGVGSASVFAAEAVDARVSGMGDISVAGAPEKVRKSGGFLADISIKK